MSSKKKIPYEIKNAREWDPNRQGHIETSSEESESSYEDEFEEDWGEGDSASLTCDQQRSQQPGISTPKIGNGQQHHNQDDSEEGWITVASNKPKKAPSSQSPSNQARQPANPKAPIRRRVARQTPSNGPSTAKKPIRSFFAFPLDNAAKAAYRHRQPPNARFELHKNASEVEPDRAKMYDMLAEMGVRFRSFIRPPQE